MHSYCASVVPHSNADCRLADRQANIVVKCCAVLVTDSLSLNYTLLKFRDRESVKAFYDNFYLV